METRKGTNEAKWAVGTRPVGRVDILSSITGGELGDEASIRSCLQKSMKGPYSMKKTLPFQRGRERPGRPSVDKIKGGPFNGWWGGNEDGPTELRVAEGLHAFSSRRTRHGQNVSRPE